MEAILLLNIPVVMFGQVSAILVQWQWPTSDLATCNNLLACNSNNSLILLPFGCPYNNSNKYKCKYRNLKFCHNLYKNLKNKPVLIWRPAPPPGSTRMLPMNLVRHRPLRPLRHKHPIQLLLLSSNSNKIHKNNHKSNLNRPLQRRQRP